MSAEKPYPIYPTVLDGNFSHKATGLLKDYVGSDWRTFLGPFPTSMEEIAATEARVNAHVLKMIVERYGVNPDDAIKFYREQLNNANRTVEYVIDKALGNSYRTTYGLGNETAFPTDSPFDNLCHVTGFLNVMDPLEQYERERQHIIAPIAAQVTRRSREEGYQVGINNFQKLMNMHVFENVPGTSGHTGERKKTTIQRVLAAHDNTDNSFQGVLPAPDFTGQYHTKEHAFRARYSSDVGWVVTDPREKGMEQSVVKGLTKAIVKGKEVNVVEDVQDVAGVMFVTLGDDNFEGGLQSRDTLAEKVIQTLKHSGRLKDLKEKHHLNEDRNNGKSLPWLRYEVQLHNGCSSPFELVFYDLKQYLDYRYFVGDLEDPTKHAHGHPLYEVIRAQRIFPDLFPKRIYNGRDFGQFDLEEIMRARRYQEAANMFRDTGIRIE